MVGGAIPRRLEIGSNVSTAGRLGPVLLALAVALYPLLAPITGRAWSGAEIFGIAPDPTAVATLAVALAARRAPWELVPIPALWCLLTALLGVATDTAVLLVPAGLALIAVTALAARGRAPS